MILDFHDEKMVDVHRERIFLWIYGEIFVFGYDFPCNHNFPYTICENHFLHGHCWSDTTFSRKNASSVKYFTVFMLSIYSSSIFVRNALLFFLLFHHLVITVLKFILLSYYRQYLRSFIVFMIHFEQVNKHFEQ